MIKQVAEETYNNSGKPLYLFVVIMKPDSNGTYNTWLMLNALGQSDGYPEIKKQFYDDKGKPIRQHLWGIHTNHLSKGDDLALVYKAWDDIIEENQARKKNEQTPYAPLIAFEDKRTRLWQID